MFLSVIFWIAKKISHFIFSPFPLTEEYHTLFPVHMVLIYFIFAVQQQKQMITFQNPKAAPYLFGILCIYILPTAGTTPEYTLCVLFIIFPGWVLGLEWEQSLQHTDVVVISKNPLLWVKDFSGSAREQVLRKPQGSTARTTDPTWPQGYSKLWSILPSRGAGDSCHWSLLGMGWASLTDCVGHHLSFLGCILLSLFPIIVIIL